MADWFTGKDGSDANSGATWPLRKLTITAMVGVAWAAGDRLYVGPGVYREEVLVWGDSGIAVTAVGTVSVINESQIATFAGVNLGAAGVLAGDQLFIGNFASGADGQTYGNDAFTSAGGNFQANMIGYMIEIVTEGAYLIGAVGGAGAITLIDQNNIGWPGVVGPGLDYYVVSGEGPYEVESVDTAVQLTLIKPWSGPTLTDLDHEIYRPIYLIADTTGAVTDGVGGVVRITGSDDDETRNRSYGIQLWNLVDPVDYWHIRGFRIDCVDNDAIEIDGANYIVVEDCSFIDCDTSAVSVSVSSPIIVRRCVIFGVIAYGIDFDAVGSEIANSQCLIENVYIHTYIPISLDGYGGVTIKNLTLGFNSYSGIVVWGTIDNTAVFVHDCLLHFCGVLNAAVDAWTLGDIVESFNNFWSNETDRFRVDNTEGNSTAYAYLPALPLLTGRVRNPMVSFFAPSQWEPTRNATGLYGKNEDLFRVHNEIAQTRRSWGAQHNYATVRSEDQFQGTFTGSLFMESAMEQQFVFPVREDWDYTVTVQVYLEANYAGNPPQMTVKQPEVASATVTSTGAIGSWHQLSVEFTTGSAMDWINVSLRSRNTSVLANVGCYWQDLAVN